MHYKLEGSSLRKTRQERHSEMFIIQLSALWKTSQNKVDESVPGFIQKELKAAFNMKESFNSQL